MMLVDTIYNYKKKKNRCKILYPCHDGLKPETLAFVIIDYGLYGYPFNIKSSSGTGKNPEI